MTTLEELERRVQRLEDVEAIAKLKGSYARFCDEGYDADGIASLFVEDGIWEGEPLGRFEGREAIRSFFASVSASFVWAQHYMICPMIDVAEDGRTATGRWWIFEPVTFAGENASSPNEAAIVMAQYEDDFRKVETEWRFVHLRARIFHISNLDQGWVRQPMRGA